MKEIALHLLDIVQNSVTAGAGHVNITFDLGADGMLSMTVEDDGRRIAAAIEREGVLVVGDHFGHATAIERRAHHPGKRIRLHRVAHVGRISPMGMERPLKIGKILAQLGFIEDEARRIQVSNLLEIKQGNRPFPPARRASGAPRTGEPC